MPEAIREGDIPGVQLRCRQPLGIPPAEAWGWLTEPAKLALWLADEAEVQPGPEGSLLLLTRRSEGVEGAEGAAGPEQPEGPPRRERGRTLSWAPRTQWVLAFEQLDAGWTAATRLTLTVHLHPELLEAAEVDVLQHGFQRLPLSLCLPAWEAYRRRWRTALARLASTTQ